MLLPSSYTAPDGASGTQRPDLVPGVSLTPPGGRSVAEWINPAAFATPAGEFGTAPRDLLRGPGTWQIDIGVAKTFRIAERAQLGIPLGVLQHLQSPAVRSAAGHFQPRRTPTGFGSIINTVNLNTAIVNPITPVGSGTPREIQFALRLDF